jgi:uridine kinase
MNEMQQRILELLISKILDIKTSTPLLIGVDGKDASGKTTFANSLSSVLQKQAEREIIRVSLDDFFQPRALRSHQENQAIGCYEDTFDIQGIINYLLAPIKSNRSYTTKIFDYKTDTSIDIITQYAASDAIFVIDGVFLQRPEFREYWDYTVLLDVSDETAIERGAVRDTNRIGDIEAARSKYINRYIASQKIYYDECEPQKRSDIIIDNTDYKNPIVLHSSQV